MRSLPQLLRALAALLAPWFLVSCATAPVALDAVGPGPRSEETRSGEGNLVVYSDTDEKRLDKTLPFYVHSSYLVESSAGKRLKWVPNHLGDMDETPQRVSLPAGTYKVVARSEDYGRVSVPVVIAFGRTTEVHLEDTWRPRETPTGTAQLVRFPNGYIIGWAAPTRPGVGGP